MGQNWQKLQIQDLPNKVYPKGQIQEITIFFLIDLNKIRLKNVPAPKVAKLTISKWAFF